MALANRTKSDIYREFLPLVTSGRLELVDDPRLIKQLLALERSGPHDYNQLGAHEIRGGTVTDDRVPKEHPMNSVAVLQRVMLAALAIGCVGFSGGAAAETVSYVITGAQFAKKPGGPLYAGGRGFSVVAVDPATATGEVTAARTFDTWGLGCPAFDELVALLDSFPIRTLLLLAIGDSAGLGDNECSERARRALEGLGSTKIRAYKHRHGWAMIAIKGGGEAVTEDLSDRPWDARLPDGRRPPPLVLEATLVFPLASPTPSSSRALWCGSPETAPPFDPIEVAIEDASGNHLIAVGVLRPTTVCAPYGLNTSTEPPTTVDAWIVCYELTGIPLDPHMTFRVQTALGTHTMDVGAAHTVCIPARPVN